MAMKDEKQKVKRSSSGSVWMILFSIIFAVLGVLLIMIPQITTLTLCYFFCAALAAFGIFLIVRYFLTESFRSLNQYGFSTGVLFVIISMCALVKADVVSGYFLIWLGVFVVISAVLLLQDCLDLIVMKDKSWPLWLIIAAAFAVCGILILLNPFTKESDYHLFTYYVMTADGAFCLIATIYLYFRIRAYEKREEKEALLEQEKHENQNSFENDDILANTNAQPEVINPDNEPDDAASEDEAEEVSSSVTSTEEMSSSEN